MLSDGVITVDVNFTHILSIFNVCRLFPCLLPARDNGYLLVAPAARGKPFHSGANRVFHFYYNYCNYIYYGNYVIIIAPLLLCHRGSPRPVRLFCPGARTCGAGLYGEPVPEQSAGRAENSRLPHKAPQASRTRKSPGDTNLPGGRFPKSYSGCSWSSLLTTFHSYSTCLPTGMSLFSTLMSTWVSLSIMYSVLTALLLSGFFSPARPFPAGRVF